MREKRLDEKLIKRRLLSLLLAVFMLIGTLPLSPLKVYALEPNGGYPPIDPIDPYNGLAKYYDDYLAYMSLFIDPNLKKAIQEKLPHDVAQITLGDYIKYIGSSLDINKRGIKSLKGIEQFDYYEYTPKNVTLKRALLKYLDCDDNEITSIDLTKNPNIFILSCNRNKISNLKLNSKIEYLNCNKNLITNLNLSQSKSLKLLDCSNNNITNLDPSQNKNLEMLACSKNKLSALNTNGLSELWFLVCGSNPIEQLNISTNTILRLLEADNCNLQNIDLTKNTDLVQLVINNNKLSNLNIKNNTNLQTLICSNNQLSSLDVENNGELITLDCSGNQLSDLSIVWNKKLQYLNCSNNKINTLMVYFNTKLKELDCSNNGMQDLMSLPLLVELEKLNCSNNKLKELYLPESNKIKELDCSNNELAYLQNASNIGNLKGDNQQINVKAYENEKIIKKEDLNKLVIPDADSKVKEISGGKIYHIGSDQGKGIKVDDNLPAKVTYKYEVKPGMYLDVTMNIQYIGLDPSNVVSMKIKEQPTKLAYTDGDKLDLDGLVVTLEDNKGLTKDVTPADFGKYNITVTPANGKALTLADNAKKVTLTKESLTAETEALTVNEKVFDPDHVEKMEVKTQPKLVYTDGEELALAGLVVTLTDNQSVTKDVAFKDFAANGITANPTDRTALTLDDSGNPVVLTKGSLQDETENLTVNAKVTPQDPPVVGPVDPQDPNGGKPQDTSKYWTITFESADEAKGTVAAKNTVYVLKTETKTLADITAPGKTAAQGYEFDKWEPALDNATTITGDLTVKAYFKATGTPTPQDPPVVGPVDPEDPNGGKPQDTSKYWTVTFESADEAKGTVAAKNTVYVLKTETKTLADITAPGKTAAQGYEFDKWEPALDNATAITGDLTVKAYFKQAGTPTPQDPPVVGPVDPTQPGGENPDTSKYWTITFESADETKGTVAAKNTVYVLKTENKTLADITAPGKTAAQGYEFDKWEPALDNATAITGDLTVKAYFKASGTNPPTPPTPTPNPSLDDKIDDSNKKPVYPIDQDQGTGVIVKDPDDIVVGGKDEDGKNIPTVIDPNTGEIIVNPGNDVDGPIVVTVVDTKTGEQKDIVIDVIGHSSGRDDNRYYDHDNWYAPLRRDHSSSSDTTKVNTSVNTERAKKVSRLEVRLVIGSKVLRKSIDGIEEITMMDIAPFIEKDRTMLPIRFVAEALGFNVKWDNDSRTVILIDKENVVKIPVDTNQIIVNGKVYESDVKPVIRNDRTMLPIANIARALGLKDGKDIFWNGNTKEVLITREVAK